MLRASLSWVVLFISLIPIAGNHSWVHGENCDENSEIDVDCNNNGMPDRCDVERLLDFAAAFTFSVGQQSGGVAVAPLDADPFPDLVVAGRRDAVVHVAYGRGDGTFGNVVTLEAEFEPVAVTVADFDLDGVNDILSSNSSSLTLFLGEEAGGFQAARALNAGAAPHDAVTGHFNADEFVDIAVADSVDDVVTVLLGRGDGTFDDPVSLPAADRPAEIVACHLNDDAFLDLAVATQSSSERVWVFLGNGDGSFQDPSSFRTLDTPTELFCADATFDDVPDLVVSSCCDDFVAIYPGANDGTFGDAPLIPVPDGNAALVADMNVDDVPDLTADTTSRVGRPSPRSPTCA